MLAPSCVDEGVPLHALETVDLRLTLTLDQPLPHWTNHRMQVYEEGHTHPLLVACCDIVPGRETRVAFHRMPGPRRPLCFRWYADRTTDDGVVAQESCGSGYDACDAQTATIQMADSESVVEASVRIGGWSVQQTGRKPLDMALAESLIADTTRVYTRQHTAQADVFCDFGVYLDGQVRQMPIMFWAVLAVQMRAEPHQATLLFEHLLRVCERFYPDEDDANMLAQVLALPTIGWVYRPDLTARGVDTDLWSMIWSWPDPQRAAFDCDDGAQACYELFHVFANTDLRAPGARLARLQILARQYTPYFVTGELLSSDGSAHVTADKRTYMMHCYLALMPTDPAAVDLRAITIESTDVASGAWMRKSTRPTRAETITHSRQIDAAKSAGELELARVRAPIAVVRARGLYGRVHQAWTASMPGGESAHLVCHAGTQAEQLFTRADWRTALCTQVMHTPTRVLERTWAAHMALTPRALFPAPPDDTRLPAATAQGDLEVLVARRTRGAQVYILHGVALSVL